LQFTDVAGELGFYLRPRYVELNSSDRHDNSRGSGHPEQRVKVHKRLRALTEPDALV